jgi:hypothetical protein
MKTKMTHTERRERVEVILSALREDPTQACIHETAERFGLTTSYIWNLTRIHKVKLKKSAKHRKCRVHESRLWVVLSSVLKSPTDADAEIGRAHNVSREYVGQIRFLADKYGILELGKARP